MAFMRGNQVWPYGIRGWAWWLGDATACDVVERDWGMGLGCAVDCDERGVL